MLSVTSILDECLKKIEAILAKFFWESTEYGRRHHWYKWTSICLSVEDGGLGICNLRDVRKAFILKKCGLVSSSDTLWGKFMRSKYRITSTPIFWTGPQRYSPKMAGACEGSV